MKNEYVEICDRLPASELLILRGMGGFVLPIGCENRRRREAEADAVGERDATPMEFVRKRALLTVAAQAWEVGTARTGRRREDRLMQSAA